MTFRPKPSCLSSARLACVKRAASVHPEPGSNSLKSLFPQIFRSVSLLFLGTSISLEGSQLVSLLTIFFLASDVTLFGFQGPFASRPPSGLSRVQKLFYHGSRFLSIPFFPFFKVFFGLTAPCRLDLSSRAQVLVYYKSTSFVKPFLIFFAKEFPDKRN